MLPKPNRIRKGNEIKEIIRVKGKRTSSPLLSIYTAENKNNDYRLAVICSGKIGNAVKRNRMRRVIMDEFMKNSHKIGGNMDILVFPNQYEGDGKTIRTELNKCLTRNNASKHS